MSSAESQLSDPVFKMQSMEMIVDVSFIRWVVDISEDSFLISSM